MGVGAEKGLAAARRDAANVLVVAPGVKPRSMGRAGDSRAAML